MPALGNLVVGQSGGPTAVINCSLQGIVQEAMSQPAVDGIFGMLSGIQGLLSGNLVDLRREDPRTVGGLGHTPSAALGTGRFQLTESDLDNAVSVLRANKVRHFVYIGGNDSADTSCRIAAAAERSGWEMSVVGVPKTIDNDLPEMDHTPGYPSIARYVAMAARDTVMDAEATRSIDPVVILEVMGRNSGWVASAAALARSPRQPAPHLIYVPERPLSADRFLADVAETHQRHGFVVAVIAETIRDENGAPWAQAPEDDAFGHPRLVGAAKRLCALARAELGLRARFNTPGTLQRSAAAWASPVDRAEALAAGEAAVRAAVAGRSGQMVTIQRLPGRPYRSYTGLTPLSNIANRERHMPQEFLAPSGCDVSAAFLRYVRPLIGARVSPYPRLQALPLTPSTAS